MHHYTLGLDRLESSFAENLVIVVDRLTMSWPCALAAMKADIFLGCIRRSVVSNSREVIPPLLLSTRATHLECWVQFWAPSSREIGKLWRRVKGLEDLTCKERAGTLQCGEGTLLLHPYPSPHTFSFDEVTHKKSCSVITCLV